MNTPEGEEKIPEWHIFDRIEELEDITLKLMEKADTTEPTLKGTSTMAGDARILALFAFATAFMALAADAKNPRAIKDSYINNLRKVGLSRKLSELVGSLLIDLCERIEKAKTGK